MAEPYQRIEPVLDSVQAGADHSVVRRFERFTFTGSGAEYFKIWIVNLALTVATLGIYSAWAKVRRLQYFDRNTQLAGAIFDFDGDPKVILRGRVLAVLLVGAYQYAFGFSVAAGITVVALLLAGLPYLMRGALRFRLRNTRYRGLRFRFAGSVPGAYGAYLAPTMLFLLPAVLLAITPNSKSAAALPLTYVLWPLIQGAMKHYQHGNAGYGSLASQFGATRLQFYRPYLYALGLAALGAFLLVAGLTALAGLAQATLHLHALDGVAGSYLGVALALLVGYLFYLLAGPYLQVRIGNLAWNATSCPGMSVVSELDAIAYMRLQTANSLLTILTLGLYRPFAVVRSYRYRLANTLLITDGDLAQLVTSAAAPTANANADGVADLFGLDLSW